MLRGYFIFPLAFFLFAAIKSWMAFGDGEFEKGIAWVIALVFTISQIMLYVVPKSFLEVVE